MTGVRYLLTFFIVHCTFSLEDKADFRYLKCVPQTCHPNHEISAQIPTVMKHHFIPGNVNNNKLFSIAIILCIMIVTEINEITSVSVNW